MRPRSQRPRSAYRLRLTPPKPAAISSSFAILRFTILATLWRGSSAVSPRMSIYYSGFKPPPPGAHFSSEWGPERSHDEWTEYSYDVVRDAILERAGKPDLARLETLFAELKARFDRDRNALDSILSVTRSA